MVADIVHAMSTSGQGNAGNGESQIMSLIPLVAIVIIFYFLLIRPQHKERKRVQEMLDSLKAGDNVVTTGGILGTIHSIDNDIVQLKISDKVKISVLRSFIRGLHDGKIEKD